LIAPNLKHVGQKPKYFKKLIMPKMPFLYLEMVAHAITGII